MIENPIEELRKRMDTLEQENKELRALIEEQIYHFMCMFRVEGHHGMHVITKDYRIEFLYEYFLDCSYRTMSKEDYLEILSQLSIPSKTYHDEDENEILTKIEKLDSSKIDDLYSLVLNQEFEKCYVRSFNSDSLSPGDKVKYEEKDYWKIWLINSILELKEKIEYIEKDDRIYLNNNPIISKREYLPSSTSSRMWEIFEKVKSHLKVKNNNIQYKKKIVNLYIDKLQTLLKIEIKESGRLAVRLNKSYKVFVSDEKALKNLEESSEMVKRLLKSLD